MYSEKYQKIMQEYIPNYYKEYYLQFKISPRNDKPFTFEAMKNLGVVFQHRDYFEDRTYYGETVKNPRFTRTKVIHQKETFELHFERENPETIITNMKKILDLYIAKPDELSGSSIQAFLTIDTEYYHGYGEL